LRISPTICLSIFLLLASGKLIAQEDNWNHIGMEDLVSKDSVTRKGFTLIFINKSPSFDSTVKLKMVEAFFTVYPKEAKLYNRKTLKKVYFVIDPKYTGVAATSDGIVRYNPAWFVSHPNDIDVVTHEVMHIVQSYPDGALGWLVEGVADYVRFKLGIDNKSAGWTLTQFNEKQRYTNAYRITARFLVWAEKNYTKKLVKKLDAAMRNQSYTPEIWTKLTGKTVDELWKEYASAPTI
jgi:hypothetical protein